MGGNALSVKTHRLGRKEYFSLRDEVMGLLASISPGRRVFDVQAFRQKESFGDLDVLFECDGLWVDSDDPVITYPVLHPDFMEKFLRVFKPQEFRLVKNSPVMSFDFRGFQVDLIFMPSNILEMAFHYYSWNDLGNLIGRVADSLGFKFGFAGLVYNLMDGTHRIDEITITTDVNKALPFLGYDPVRFHRGFDTLDEIFAYVTTSEYFRPDIYLYENRNHKGRTRDNKRSSYRGFLDYVREQDDLTNGETPDKEKHLQRAFRAFPEFEKAYNKALDRYRRLLDAKSRFNGELVTEVTGLTGVPLGDFMRHMRANVADKNEFYLQFYNMSRKELVDFIHISHLHYQVTQETEVL